MKKRRSIANKQIPGGFYEAHWTMTITASKEFQRADSHNLLCQVAVDRFQDKPLSVPFIIVPVKIGLSLSPSHLYLQPDVEKRVVVIAHDDNPFSLELDSILALQGFEPADSIVVGCKSGERKIHLVNVRYLRTDKPSQYRIKLRTSHPQTPHISFIAVPQ